MKKYQPLYMPASDNDDMDNQPLFNTKQKAWDFIHKKYCQCGFGNDCIENKIRYCGMCGAEWSVDEILK